MISTRHNFIFLHVPKTAGNAVQSFLLPFSDDQKVVHPHQDGVERFDVRGAVTPTKHATLQAYADRLGPRLAEFAVIAAIRDPLDRALSLYFSPFRGAGRGEGFVPSFSIEKFTALLQSFPPMVDYLKVDGNVRPPDHLLHFERIGADLTKLAEELGLPAPALPVLNRSLDKGGVRDQLKQDRGVIEAVLARFGEDYSYFGFRPPA